MKKCYFTTKCGILPQSVVIPWVTLLRIIVFYYKVITKYIIILQNVILYHRVFASECGISHELS